MGEIRGKSPLEQRAQIELFAQQMDSGNLDRGRILEYIQELSQVSSVEEEQTNQHAQEIIDLIERNKEDFVRFLREESLHRRHSKVEQIKERVGEYEEYRESVGLLRKQLENCLAEHDPQKAIRNLDNFVGAGMHGVYLSVPDHPDVIIKFIDPWMRLVWGISPDDEKEYFTQTIEFYSQMLAFSSVKGDMHFAQIVACSPEDRVLVTKKIHDAYHVDDSDAPYVSDVTQFSSFLDAVCTAGTRGIQVDFGKGNIMVDSSGNLVSVDYALFAFFQPHEESREDTISDYIQQIESFFIKLIDSIPNIDPKKVKYFKIDLRRKTTDLDRFLIRKYTASADGAL
jgi:hypothetical protein